MKLLIYGFNKACSHISEIYLKVREEFIGALRFNTTSKDNLPHLSYIFRKTEPPGKDFKKVG